MFNFFEVGGAVRDFFLGVNSKDVDFVAVPENPDGFDSVEDAFNSLHEFLQNEGFHVFLSTPEFFTIRARVPEDHTLRSRTAVADFVLARKDGPSSDGRHPDFVLPGSLLDDLSRRDFTINAMAIGVDQKVHDPFKGLEDLNNRRLRFVGNPMDRIEEDGLRILRALRFSITKSLSFSDDLEQFFLDNHEALGVHHLRSVSTERIREELAKMFAADTIGSLSLLQRFPGFRDAIFMRGDLRLMPTMKK